MGKKLTWWEGMEASIQAAESPFLAAIEKGLKESAAQVASEMPSIQAVSMDFNSNRTSWVEWPVAEFHVALTPETEREKPVREDDWGGWRHPVGWDFAKALTEATGCYEVSASVYGIDIVDSETNPDSVIYRKPPENATAEGNLK